MTTVPPEVGGPRAESMGREGAPVSPTPSHIPTVDKQATKEKPRPSSFPNLSELKQMFVDFVQRIFNTDIKGLKESQVKYAVSTFVESLGLLKVSQEALLREIPVDGSDYISSAKRQIIKGNVSHIALTTSSIEKFKDDPKAKAHDGSIDLLARAGQHIVNANELGKELANATEVEEMNAISEKIDAELAKAEELGKEAWGLK